MGLYSLHLLDIKDGQVRGSQFLGASVNYSPEFIASEPNVNLLRRLAESAGGKMLDPDLPTPNPFLHDRQKTFQPRDLWEWLLKLAVILFVLDVGVRRIQLEREEVAKAARWVRARVFFWQPAQRPAEADESLAALLTRRQQVRSSTTASAVEPRPDSFRPERPVTEPMPGTMHEVRPATPVAPPPEEPEPADTESTTSRLLEAKRRAQRRRG